MATVGVKGLIMELCDLVVSSSVTHFGTRAFAVAGPKAWNQLPMHIRAQESVGSFKTALKSHFHFVN